MRTPDHLLGKFCDYPPFWLHKELKKEDLCWVERDYCDRHNLWKGSNRGSRNLCNELGVQNNTMSTDLLRFYVREMGAECLDVTQIIQFKGAAKPFMEWMEACIEMREQARTQDKPIQNVIAKLLLNSFFGSSILKIEARKTVKYVMFESLHKFMSHQNYSTSYAAGPSFDACKMYEVEMNKDLVQQNSSKQIGFWILNVSKLVLLRFIYCVLHYYLDPSKWEINGSDTDAVVLSVACPGEDLRPIARPERATEFNANYAKIFVSRPEDTHRPLLVKIEKAGLIFIGLSTKTYILYGADSSPKRAHKGISRRNERVISLLNYLKTLFEKEDRPPQAEIRGIRSTPKEHQMSTYVQRKRGLTKFCAKVGFFPICTICDYPHDLPDEKLLEIYPYAQQHCGADFDSALARIKQLAEQYPTMNLRFD